MVVLPRVPTCCWEEIQILLQMWAEIGYEVYMRIIDADHAVKVICRNAEALEFRDRAVALSLALLLNNVDEVPSVDAVPVIRCIDCTHYSGKFKECNLTMSDVSPLHFCAKGEERC